MNPYLKRAIFQAMMMLPPTSNINVNDTSAETTIYNSKFFDSDKSILEANQKRYRKAMKKGFTGSFEEFMK